MLKRKGLLAGLAICGLASAQSWNNDPKSPNGPLSWGFLGDSYTSFATCGTTKQAVGGKQTPINIVPGSAKPADLTPLTFHYKPIELDVENLAHVVEVINAEAENTLSVGTSVPDKYKLLQFHFHTPSEHTIDAKDAQMELHLVHQNDLGELAVVGVMLQVDDAKANAAYDKIFTNAPYLTFTGANSKSGHVGEIDPTELLPEKRTYYTYTGSLTTPPCSEGVHWYVMTEPVYISAKTVSIYQSLLASSGANNYYKFNNRPVQPLNGRPVLVSK